MGSCGGVFCNNNSNNQDGTNRNKIKTDIILENKIDKDSLTKMYSQVPLIDKVIYLQKKIKSFLKRKERNRNKKIKNIKKQENEAKINNNNSEDIKNNKKKEKIIMDITTDDSNKINKKDKEQGHIEDEEDDFMKVEKISPHLMNSNLKEAFQRGKLFLENDPRDLPNDNMRRYFPKIIEEKSSYEGEWKNGMRDGFGILCWGEECKFIGNFVQNKILGYGELYNEDGDCYKGMWNNFQANGIGKYKTKHKANYIGYWLNDKQDNFGIEKWPKGSTFIGEYKDGSKNGIGIIIFENKARYEGELKDGVISGIGSFVFGENRKYEGEWKNNKMHGVGYIKWKETLFEGEFKEDKKDGFGIYYSGKKIYMGMWKDNVLWGNVIVIDGNKIKKQYWENGKLNKNLPKDTFISFEQYAEDFINEYKNKKK